MYLVNNRGGRSNGRHKTPCTKKSLKYEINTQYFTVCTRNMQTKLTIDNRWHRQHYSVAVIDNRVHRFVLNDGKVLLKMALILKIRPPSVTQK